MGHWLDQTATRLAAGELSRRDVLRSLAAAVGSGVARRVWPVAAMVGGVPASAYAASSSRAICTQDPASEGFRQHFTSRHWQRWRSVEFDGDVLETTRVDALQRRAYAVRSTGRELLRVEEVQGTTELGVRVVFGEDFVGITEARFTTTDGSTFSGSVDGREFVPFPVGAPYSSIQFADGLPPPSVDVPQSVIEAISSAYQDANDDNGSCATPGGVGSPRDAGTSGVGFGKDPMKQAECVACILGCYAGSATCGFAAAGGCAAAGPFYPICLAAALGACAVGMALCLSTCRKVGGPCCPVQCYPVPGIFGTAHGCCANGDQCLDPTRGVCCGNSLEATPCHRHSCCAPTDTCLDNGNCCPQGRQPCGFDVCCDANSACTSFGCCPQGQSCGTLCCPDATYCASDGVCCSVLVESCNGVCCGAGESCINGSCCPQARVCGSVCCPSGAACTDPGTSTCAQCGAEDLPCGPNCCYFQLACCGALGSEVCCAFGQICCSNANMPCVDPQDYQTYCVPH